MPFPCHRRLLVFLFTLFASLHAPSAEAQSVKGRITGSVRDAETFEPILGANVMIEGTSIGTATDLNGSFILPLDPGVYSVIVSVVSYTRNRTDGVSVRPGVDSELQIVMTPEAIETEEIVVEAKAKLAFEAALLTQQRSARAISDGLSAEQIRRAPDATSGDALRRLTGISLVDNKFIFIRGVTDRYNQTTLNGAPVTSTSVDKKSFSFDMLPANLVENVVVTKSATPDLPGDFTGGLVQINTLDIPDDFGLKISLGSSYNDRTTFRSFARSTGGAGDWLGADDGTRALPSFSSLTDLAQRLPNLWPVRPTRAPLNQSASLSFGMPVSVLGRPLGVITALTYRANGQRSVVDLDEDRNGQFVRRLNGYADSYSVLMGALLDLSYRFDEGSTISFRNNVNRTADDRLTFSQGFQESDGRQKTYTSEWTERSMYTGLLSGEHDLPILGSTLAWQGSLSTSVTAQPDRREIQYSLAVEYPESDPFIAEPGTRSWSRLNDRVTNVKIDWTIPVGGMRFKAGYAREEKSRSYDIRYFQTLIPSDPRYFQFLTYGLDSIYRPEHFGQGKFRFQEITRPSDTYGADQHIAASYIMIDAPFAVFSEQFRFVGGVRVEDSRQNVHTTQSFSVSEPYTAINSNVDVLPSANLTYHVNATTNLRFAFARTINRPELRELANVYFYDFNSYEGVFGNPELERAVINNYDVRLEIFPDVGELLAVSYFSKHIRNPIEEQFLYSAAPERTWINSDEGETFGWEFEVRKDFGFLGAPLKNMTVSANYSRIYSRVRVRQLVGNALTQSVVEFSRPMEGQASSMVNVSLILREPTLGTALSVLYHRQGVLLDAVADHGDVDVYEMPRSFVDCSISQPLPFSGMEAKVTIKNIGNTHQVFEKGSRVYRRVQSGTTFAFQVSLSL